MVENKTSQIIHKILGCVVLTVAALACALPFIIVLSASFSDETLLAAHGYSVIPRGFTWTGYQQAFKYSNKLFSAYGTTLFVTAVGGTLSTLFTALTAYPLSRKNYRFRKVTNFFIYFTMLFSGGAIIHTYISISEFKK